MQLFMMREEPENSGTYVDVEGGACATADEAMKLVEEKSADGGRYAFRVYEPTRANASREADMAATQRMAHPAPPAPPVAQPKV